MLKRVGMNVDYQATGLGHGGAAPRADKPPAEGGWNMFCTGFSGLDSYPCQPSAAARQRQAPGPAGQTIRSSRSCARPGSTRRTWRRRRRSARTSSFRRSRTCRTTRSAWRRYRRHLGQTLPACRRASLLLERAAKLNPRQSAGSGPATNADTIIIFGAAVHPDGAPSATLRQRVEAAAAFGPRFAAPLYVPTGAKGRYGASEASVMACLLRGLGVPPDRILLEETGTDTLSSVRAVARLIPEVAAVHVATSGYHLARCLILLWLAGIRADACPPPPAPDRLSQRWYWRIREVLALPYDVALMLGLRLAGRCRRYRSASSESGSTSISAPIVSASSSRSSASSSTSSSASTPRAPPRRRLLQAGRGPRFFTFSSATLPPPRRRRGCSAGCSVPHFGQTAGARVRS